MPASLRLARGGAPRITLIDPERVELSNLARQVIFRGADIGAFKAEAAARHLREEFPGVAISAYPSALDERNAAALFAAHDFIIDATDNPATKFLINDVACAVGRPFAYGGVLGMTGQAMTVIPGRSACLRCLFESPPDDDESASCRDAGILGPVAGVIGAIQAAEALAYAAGTQPRLAGRILIYTANGTARFRVASASARERCGCGAWAYLSGLRQSQPHQ